MVVEQGSETPASAPPLTSLTATLQCILDAAKRPASKSEARFDRNIEVAFEAQFEQPGVARKTLTSYVWTSLPP
jgi:hypothetical protein